MTNRLYAQGDIILERIEDATANAMPLAPVPADPDGALVLARGERTGHRHAFYGGGVTLLRDDALARDLPPGLYLGHLKVSEPGVELRHEEHAAIALPAGTYRVRRQQEWEPRGTQTVWE